MIPGSLFGLLPLLLGIFGVQPEPVGTVVTRLVVQDEIILRVPLQSRSAPSMAWVESKKAKCIPIGAIRHALMSGPAQLDFILADNSRVRAHLDNDCPALDFYTGFYLQPEDDRLCAGRDAIQSRMGGSCSVQSLARLVPKLKR
ncbi:hypothetical protein [Sphingomonas sp.]|uniref:hypothetical protein n=1 Tax=Sphingomonas sp. TaxID=28214 RepID=UPI0025DDF908|nr:hypothetical protein [Sphingomonas sp.]MBV9527463.1 hypothetical protein [Sphingomonas sp.]